MKKTNGKPPLKRKKLQKGNLKKLHEGNSDDSIFKFIVYWKNPPKGENQPLQKTLWSMDWDHERARFDRENREYWIDKVNNHTAAYFNDWNGVIYTLRWINERISEGKVKCYTAYLNKVHVSDPKTGKIGPMKIHHQNIEVAERDMGGY